MPPDPATPQHVRDLLLSFGESRRPEALDRAVDAADQLRSVPGFDRLDGSARALVLTLGAAALTWRARTSAARADDLDRAIDWTAAAVRAWPPGDRNLPLAQVNLATALCDRFDDRGDPDDLERAVPLFEAAVPALQAGGERVDAARHSFGVCLHTRSGQRADPRPDLERAIALFREALADPAAEPEERAGYGNSLGLSLRRKAQAVGDPALLHEAEATYRTALATAAPGGPTAQAAAANLAIVLLDRADVEGDDAALRAALTIYRDLLPTVDASRREQITTNLAGVLVSTYRFGRDRRLLDEAVTDLRTSAERLPEGPRRQVALATLAGALHELFDHTGELVFLDAAIAVQHALLRNAVRRPAPRLLNLGISLLARFRRRRNRDDLDEACRLFDEAATAGGSAVEVASAHNSHTNALSLAFDLSGLRPDIDRAIAHREAAIRAAVPGSLDDATYRANLGVDLIKRFELADDPADLDQAVAVQRAALAVVPHGSADQPRLLAALADTLARRALRDPGPGAVDEVRSTYRAAIRAGRESLPEQALGAAVRWGDWEAVRHCWAEAAAAYLIGLHTVAGLVTRQRVRADKESWLADAGTLPAAAGYALVRSRRPREAAVAVEQGRAVLLAEALSGRPHDRRDGPQSGGHLTGPGSRAR